MTPVSWVPAGAWSGLRYLLATWRTVQPFSLPMAMARLPTGMHTSRMVSMVGSSLLPSSC